LIVSGFARHKECGLWQFVLTGSEDDDQGTCRRVDVDKLLANAVT
ncbi:MAG: hypothetical protein ACI91Q_002402, partial [Gammaproteobacteria bacterium]